MSVHLVKMERLMIRSLLTKANPVLLENVDIMTEDTASINFDVDTFTQEAFARHTSKMESVTEKIVWKDTLKLVNIG